MAKPNKSHPSPYPKSRPRTSVKRVDPHRNLVVVSDLHCGCGLGLFPDKTLSLSDEKQLSPSPFQRKLLRMWRSFWDEFVPSELGNEPFCVVCNGDAIDGVHHNSTSQITHNMADQVEIAHQMLAPIRDKCDGRLYMIRGTEAHVGKSGAFEELLAQRLQSKPDPSGLYSRYELWKKCGDGLVHFLHHIGTTSSSAHEASAVNAELAASYVEAARWRERPPDVIVRSHRHRSIELRIPTAYGNGIAIVTPGWQGKSSFAYKIAGARLSPPQFGGCLIRRGKAHLYVLSKVWTVDRGEPE